MKKIFICLFVCLLLVAPVLAAGSNGQAEIYVMREIASETNEASGITVDVNGSLTYCIPPSNYICFESTPGENVLKLDGNNFVVDAQANESYYIKVDANKLILMDKSEGEKYLSELERLNPEPMNKLISLKKTL